MILNKIHRTNISFLLDNLPEGLTVKKITRVRKMGRRTVKDNVWIKFNEIQGTITPLHRHPQTPSRCAYWFSSKGYEAGLKRTIEKLREALESTYVVQ